MPPDPISATALVELTAKVAPSLLQPVKGMAARAKEKLQVEFSRGFARYLEENAKRFSNVKTIISSSTLCKPKPCT
jgi:hypothetical protein